MKNNSSAFKEKAENINNKIAAALSSKGEKYGLLFLPLLCVWLELALHIFDKSKLLYWPVYTLFAVSLGFAAAALLLFFKGKTRRILTKVSVCVLSVLYMAEFIAKEILQTYYPFSILGTAADNKLYQFIGIIVETVAMHLHHLLIMALPCIFFMLYGKYIIVDRKTAPASDADAAAARKQRKKARQRFLNQFAIAVIFFAAFHFAGLLSLEFSWSGDLTPADLYRMDINYNEQVEQLGLYSMLRLDIKHMFVAADYADEFDASLIADIPEEPVPAESAPQSPKIEEPEAPEPSAEPEPEPEDPVDRSPNIMDVDLAALKESTSSKDVKWLCDYFSSTAPTNKNEYTGMFEGYNVIFFTLEAFDSCAVSEKYTPTLYKLMNEGFVFSNFYSALHFTSTSNGECQNLLGLYPKNGKPITMVRTGQLKTNTYFTLARQLNRLGYVSQGYHNNWDLYERSSSHPNAGYQWNWCSRGLSYEKTGSGDLKWPQRDSFMIEDSVDKYINGEEPFNIYYLTVSAHTPYSWNWVASQYKEQLSDCEYSETTKAYIATIMEVDKAMQILLEKLEEAGKLENTLIVAAPDHVPYTAIESVEEMTGKELGSSAAAQAINEAALDLDVYRNGLIIWSASMKEPVQVDKVCCQVDILPTVSNLLGLEYDSRMLSGRDILSEEEGMVVFSSRCWKTDKGLYNRFTQKFTPAEGIEMSPEETEEYVNRTKAIAGYRLDCTAKIVESNFYDKLFPEKN